MTERTEFPGYTEFIDEPPRQKTNSRGDDADHPSGLYEGLKIPHPDLGDRAEYKACDERQDERSSGDRQDTSQKDQQRQQRPQQRQQTGDWDEPDPSIMDDRRGELPELPIQAFSSSICTWLINAARGAGVTSGHVAVPFIGIASSLIGTARRVQASKSWRQPVTCWACLVGPSGSGKTPAIDVTKRALSLIERNRKTEIAALQMAHDTRVEAAKAALKKWKDEVAEAVEAGRSAPQKPAQALDIKPFVAPRLYVNDSTIERIAPLIEVRPRGIAYIADELARLFLNMQRYSNGSDREFWLEAWDGGSYVVERQGRPPIVVPYLLVGVIGAFQPDKLSRSFEGDADGIYARFLYGWPPEPDYRPLVDDIDEVDPELVNALGRLIGLQSEEDGVFAPRSVPLSGEASGVFAQFAQFSHQGKGELDGREREYWSKGTAHVLRLAGTLTFLDWAWVGGPEPQTIPAQHVEAAVLLWREYFWPHARAALRQMGLSEKHADARRVLRWAKANDRREVSREDLRREALGQHLDAEETQAVIDALVRAGWLREATVKLQGPGRPARRWEVNPKLFL